MNTLSKATFVRAAAVVLLTVLVMALVTRPRLTAAQEIEGQGDGAENTLAPPASSAWLRESEPNNHQLLADRIAIGDSVGGIICRPKKYKPNECRWPYNRWDEDWFKFSVTTPGVTPVLIEVSARAWGSKLDPHVCLWDSQPKELGCSNDSGPGSDSLFYINLAEGDYYIQVVDDNGRHGDSSFYYRLYLSSPLLISANAKGLGTGKVQGIKFEAQDILAFSRFRSPFFLGGGSFDRWFMLFDGSDLGIKANLTNISNGPAGTDWLLLGFRRTLSHVTLREPITPHDWVTFKPHQYDQGYGQQTQGQFELTWQGRYTGFSRNGEKLDALDLWGLPGIQYNGVYLSTFGRAKVPSWDGKPIHLNDEDVALWLNTAGQLTEPFFDGSNVEGLASEDVYAASIDLLRNKLYLTIHGDGWIAQNYVTQKDIFAINVDNNSFGGIVWHGPDHGWNYDIDGFEWNGP